MPERVEAGASPQALPPQTTPGFRDPKVLLPFLLVTLIWSSTWIVIKDQLGANPETAVPPVWSVTYRFLISGAAMLLGGWLMGQGLRLGRGGHVLAVLLGTLQFVVNYNFVYASELYITSGLAAVVFALLVVPNSLLAWLLFGQRVTAGFVLGSAIAMAGVAALFIQEVRAAATATPDVLKGLGFVLVAVLGASGANVMQLMPAVRGRPIAPLLGWAMLYGALLDGLFGWIVVGPPVVEARAGYWIGLVYLGLVASALAFWLYFEIIRKIGPARAAYSSVLIPIIAMLISTVLEDYVWSPLAIAGGLLGLIGLVVALRAGPAPASATPPR